MVVYALFAVCWGGRSRFVDFFGATVCSSSDRHVLLLLEPQVHWLVRKAKIEDAHYRVVADTWHFSPMRAI